MFVNNKVKSVQFQLTTECNERCIFCRKYTWPKKQADIKMIEEKIRKYHNASLQFSGGEPTMYEHIAELNELLVDKVYKVYTNGAIDEHNEEVDKFLRNADEVVVSFDALSKANYNKIRRPLDEFAFYSVCRTISKFSNKCKLSMVVTSENIDFVPLIVKFADEQEVKSRFYPVHTNTEGLVVTDEQLKICKERVESLKLDYPESTNVFDIFNEGYFDTKREFIPCFARNYSRLIDEDGREYFCCYAINDNGFDIDGKNEIDTKISEHDVSIEYDYCDHCTRYRAFNEGRIANPKFM